MILDSGAEEHSGFWTVWSLGRHDENSNFVRGSSLFAVEKQKRHDVIDDGARWILQVVEPRTQWESITSCCRMLIGLKTSKTVAAILELQFGSRILLETLGILCVLHPGNDLCNYFLGDLSGAETAQQLLSFVKRSLSDKYDRTMKEMLQRQKDAVFSSGIECSINTMLLRHNWWMNYLVRNEFMGCNLDILGIAFGSVLVMTDDSFAKNLCGLLPSERRCRRSSHPKPQKYVSERTMRHHVSLHKS